MQEKKEVYENKEKVVTSFWNSIRHAASIGFQFVVYSIIFLAGIAICALALLVVLILRNQLVTNVSTLSNFVKLAVNAVTIIGGYFVFGVVLLVLLAVINRLMPGRKWEGTRRINDWRNASWFLSEASLILSGHLFLPLFRGTPLIRWFYQAMGAKIGRNTVIASTRISDWDILEIGNNCIIGGDCVLNGHSGERGNLVRKRVIIGDRVTIGQYTTVLPGAHIENDVVVGANSLVPKNANLRSGKVYGGVPVRDLSTSKLEIGDGDSRTTRPIKKKKSLSEESFRIGKKENLQLLLESYRLRHNEVVALETFISAVYVGSLGALAGVFVYSIAGHQPEMISLLPIIAALSGLVLIALIGDMYDLGFHMASIETALKKRGAVGFGWESKFGAMAGSGVVKLPGIVITSVFAVVYAASLYLTFWGPLLQPSLYFLGFSLRNAVAIADLFLGVACVLTYVYTTFRLRRLKEKLRLQQRTDNM